MNFQDIRLNGREPVYIQLVTYVKRSIASGAAGDGEALPSRRELAALLGINPNTVQKAYKQMEDEGFVQTPRNANSTLRVTPCIRVSIEEELSTAFIKSFVQEAHENKLGYKRVIELISQYWEEDV